MADSCKNLQLKKFCLQGMEMSTIIIWGQSWS